MNNIYADRPMPETVKKRKEKAGEGGGQPTDKKP